MIVVQNKPSSTLSTRPPISSRWWHVLVFRGWYSQCWKCSWKSYRTAGPVSVKSFRSYWEVLGPTNEGQRPESERHRREALLGGVRGHNPPRKIWGKKWGNLGAIWWLLQSNHDDVIRWKHFPHYWPFVRGIHRSPVNSPHKGQWRGGLMFSLICAWINGWINNRKAGNLRRRRAHYEIIIMNASQIIHFTCIYICQINNFTNISPSFSTQGEMRSLMISFYLSLKIFDFFVKLLICMLRNWCSVTVDVLKKNKNLILKLINCVLFAAIKYEKCWASVTSCVNPSQQWWTIW